MDTGVTNGATDCGRCRAMAHERGRLWQAEYMATGIRNHALALACIRHGLPAVHSRGTDRLPSEVTAKFDRALVERLDAPEIAWGFHVVIDGFIGEVRHADEALADRLQETASLLKRRAG